MLILYTIVLVVVVVVVAGIYLSEHREIPLEVHDD